MSSSMNRRRFLAQSVTGISALSALSMGCKQEPNLLPPAKAVPGQDSPLVGPRPLYKGPKVILVRFGGGVRRQETISDATKTWCPFIRQHLVGKGRGSLFTNVEIATNPGVQTSHGQGTLYLLTGQYDSYEDITDKPLAARFEAKIPTVFEYLRRYYDVPEHQCLIVNGEDRIDEEFYTFSNHHLYGAKFRSTVLSLYRYKTFLLREELKTNKNLSDSDRQKKEEELRKMEKLDYRVSEEQVTSNPLDSFWRKWKNYYGKTGLVNPRGDRVLTALAIWAIRELQPKLMMINYQDPDYVHWGNPSHYTRAISVIDEGVREIFNTVYPHGMPTVDDGNDEDKTVFVIAPDCGRDNNRLMDVPFQHHFNSKSSREIFAIVAGPKWLVPHSDTPNPRKLHQISVTSTIGDFMEFPTPHCPAESLKQHA